MIILMIMMRMTMGMAIDPLSNLFWIRCITPISTGHIVMKKMMIMMEMVLMAMMKVLVVTMMISDYLS